jgi:hypothetical protein
MTQVSCNLHYLIMYVTCSAVLHLFNSVNLHVSSSSDT